LTADVSSCGLLRRRFRIARDEMCNPLKGLCNPYLPGRYIHTVGIIFRCFLSRWSMRARTSSSVHTEAVFGSSMAAW